MENTLKLLCAGGRVATVLLPAKGLYHTAEPVTVTLNGEPRVADTVVTSLTGLEPDTDYTLTALGQTLAFHTEAEPCTLNVRDMGAVGDGVHEDTAALQTAIMLCPPKGRVLVPAGQYLTLPLFLKSGLRLELAKGAELLLVTDRNRFPILPAFVRHAEGDVLTATWEGSPQAAYASLLTGLDAEDVMVYGEGVLDGQGRKGDWWVNPKVRRGAWRGNMLFLRGCRGFTMQGVTVRNSPSWNLHPFRSDDLRFLNVTVEAPWDSPNTDGLDPESCDGVTIAGCHFSLGDDCIAVKSGKLDAVPHRPCTNIDISHCLMENGHGGVTIGSEMAGGVQRMTVRDTLMRNTDRGLRIKTRRGRGRDGFIDGILFDNVRMEKVGTPFVVNSLYFCDPDGHDAWVQTTEKRPVDDTTPRIGEMTFRRIEADGCACAGYFLGLPEQPVESLVLEDVSVVCDPDAKPMQPAMADCVPKINRTGFVIRFVDRFTMRNVSVTGCEGERIQADEHVRITEM